MGYFSVIKRPLVLATAADWITFCFVSFPSVQKAIILSRKLKKVHFLNEKMLL